MSSAATLRLRRTWHLTVWGRHRMHPGDFIFTLTALAAWAAAALLATLPPRLGYSPSLATLYAIPPMLGVPGQVGWAVVWALIGVAPAAAVLRPCPRLRARAWEVLLGAGLCWTVGLAWPLLVGVVAGHGLANWWAPLVWGLLTASGAVIWALIPLDAPFYKPSHRR